MFDSMFLGTFAYAFSLIGLAEIGDMQPAIQAKLQRALTRQ